MATAPFDLRKYGINVAHISRNAAPASLCQDAVRSDQGQLTSTGALATTSGGKTGRSPDDKRVVASPTTRDDIWWGPVNQGISSEGFQANRRRAVDYLNTCKHLYVVDGFAGWNPARRIKVRIICTLPYHALFMHNMLICPSQDELRSFGEPDYVVLNAGAFPADPDTPSLTSNTSVCLDFESGEFVILGTLYAGEMKKGVFTIMNYLLPREGLMSMHCSANEGTEEGDVSLFFGLSGTGKTTLSADPRRRLIGDDEHGWSDEGVFNIEGGCYAKCVNLSAETEPEIYSAIRFGTVLENVVVSANTREVDFADTSITENTRASYPIEFIPNAKIPCVGGHPRNIILLTCDAFGVLPPVSKLSPPEAMYHFISGYTAKVAGTEVGVSEPKATFSACYGAAFLVWHPTRYAELLAELIRKHHVNTWLVNTGWSGGAYGEGKRIKLAYTRAIIDAIHDGSLAEAETAADPIFGLGVPQHCAGVPIEILTPENTWKNKKDFHQTAKKLARLFRENFETFADHASEEVLSAGPNLEAARL